MLFKKYKLINIIFINIIIFVSILIILETIFFSLRFFNDRPNLGWVIIKQDLNMHSSNCLKMSTHPILGYHHDHEGGCIIKNAKAIGEYVYYRNKINDQNIKILTLGGSTTDGWYTHYSNGETWPKIIDDICYQNKNNFNDCSVINGAVGGYNSSQELLKLITSGSNLDQDIRVIISYNGINEIESYRGTNKFINNNLPFFTSEMASMYVTKKWFRQSRNFINLFPNINSFIRYLTGSQTYNIEKSKNLVEKDFKDLINKKIKINSVVDRWVLNTSLMHSVSEELNSKYFVFLQPTLGLKETTKYIPKNSNDFLLLENLDNKYISSINLLYDKLRVECRKKDYCIDLSLMKFSNGNSYTDARHHNENGNLKIAKKIFLNIRKELE